MILWFTPCGELGRWLTKVLLVLTAAAVVVGCGGGTPQAINQVRPTQGVVYPAIQGLVVLDLDDRGRELQRSIATDAQGRFSFPQPIRGARVESAVLSRGWAAAATRSARLTQSMESLQVTPLSTLYDQLLATGRADDVARSSVLSLITGACQQVESASLSQALMQGAVDSNPSLEPLQLALHAYLNGLRDIGVQPAGSKPWWWELAQKHRTVLGSVCTAAYEIYAPTWRAAATAGLSAAGAALAAQNKPALDAARLDVTQEVLALLSQHVVSNEYSQLVDAKMAGLAPDSASSVSASELALSLLAASLESKVLRNQSAAAGSDAQQVIKPVLSRNGLRLEAASIALAPGDQLGGVRLTNNDTTAKSINIVINGAKLGGMADVVADVLAMPRTAVDESLASRAWRYMTARHRHQYPLTVGRMIHQTDLYVRSLGFGFCDDASTALSWIWRALGYEARVWALEGHVVSEVLESNHWSVYDADLQLYYTMSDGAKAGVLDMATDSSIITAPLSPLLKLDNGAYWPELAASYSSQQDNSVLEWFNEPIAQPLPAEFTLPPGAVLEIWPGQRRDLQTIVPGFTEKVGVIQLRLPAGFSGDVVLPLILIDVKGSGVIQLPNGEVDVASANVASKILEFFADTNATEVGVSQLRIRNVGAGGLTLYLAVNADYFLGADQATLEFSGVSLKQLSVAKQGPRSDI